MAKITRLPPSNGLGMSDSQFKSRFKKKTKKEARNEVKQIQEKMMKSKKKYIKNKISDYYSEKNYQEKMAYEMKKWI